MRIAPRFFALQGCAVDSPPGSASGNPVTENWRDVTAHSAGPMGTCYLQPRGASLIPRPSGVPPNTTRLKLQSSVFILASALVATSASRLFRTRKGVKS